MHYFDAMDHGSEQGSEIGYDWLGCPAEVDSCLRVAGQHPDVGKPRTSIASFKGRLQRIYRTGTPNDALAKEDKMSDKLMNADVLFNHMRGMT